MLEIDPEKILDYIDEALDFWEKMSTEDNEFEQSMIMISWFTNLRNKITDGEFDVDNGWLEK